MTVRGPDFFIVGAPKSGTTAMADYLGQHPEIGMCERKETHYFARDLRSRLAVKRNQHTFSEDEYRAFFAEVQDRRRLGEASVWYLYSAAAPEAIRDFSPDADIIVMLRSPAEMLPSLHSEFVYGGIEPVEGFAEAIELDPERERSGAPPGFPPRSYRSAVRYAEQLRRYLDVFGRQSVHVILYDEFRDDTLDTFRGTCEFLGVDSRFMPALEVVNPNKRVRSRVMRQLVRRPPEALRTALHAVTTQRMRRRTGLALKRWNTRFVPRGPVPGDVRELLQGVVEEEVRDLRELIGMDLSAWLE